LIAAQGSVRIPVDEHVAALIPYRGYERSFVYISAVDVLKGRASAEQLLAVLFWWAPRRRA
jgi:adenylate cyclase